MVIAGFEMSFLPDSYFNAIQYITVIHVLPGQM